MKPFYYGKKQTRKNESKYQIHQESIRCLKSCPAIIRIKEPEKDCFIRCIKVFCSEYISFKCAKQNKQKPSESQAHVHITQTKIRFKYFPVEKTLHENLFNTKSKCYSKEPSLQP